jgi:hypothetical protein
MFSEKPLHTFRDHAHGSNMILSENRCTLFGVMLGTTI